MSRFDDTLRIRVPNSLSQRLKSAAEHLSRKPSDIAREGIVLQLNRLSGRQFTHDPDLSPPEAA